MREMLLPRHAVKDGNLYQMKRYLAEGVEIEIRDERQSTPLSWASNYGHLDIVKHLVEHSTNVNSQTNKGEPQIVS